MRLGQKSAIYFVSKFLGSVIGFFATVLLARLLGKAVLGKYATVLALITWLSLFTKIGLSKSIKKRLSEEREVGEFAGAGLIAMVGITISLALLLLLFRDWVNRYIGADVTYIIAFIILIAAINTFSSSALHGRHQVHISSILTTTSQFLRSIGQILLLLAGYGLHAMLLVYAFSRLLTGIVAFRYVDTSLKMPSRKHFESLFEFAKFSWLGNVQSRVFNTMDLLLLKLFVGSGIVGIYSAAWSIGLVLDIFGDAVRSALFPEMSKVSSQESSESVATLVEDALAFTGLLLIPGFVGGLVVGDRLLRIYGEGFGSGVEVLAILLFALLIYTFAKQLLNALNAIDRPDLAFKSNSVLIASNVLLNLVLIHLFGWTGAAVATLISGGLGAVFSGYYVNKLIDVSVPVKEISQQWIAAISMGVIVYYLRAFTEGHLIAQYNEVFVVLLVSVGAAVYFGVLMLISSRFRYTVSDNLHLNT